MKYPLVSESNVQYKQYTHELFTEMFTGGFGGGGGGIFDCIKIYLFRKGVMPMFSNLLF